MATTTDRFDSTLKPEEVLQRFQALCEEKGWDLTERTDDGAEARKGMSWKAFRENIELSVSPADNGALVHLVVHVAQLSDWGGGDDVAEEIRAALAG